MRTFLTFLIIIGIFTWPLFHEPSPVSGKKKITRRSVTTRQTTTNTSNKPVIRPKLRGDRKALIVNFSNLSSASSVTYELSYTTEGIPQGVMGSLMPDSPTTQREVLFGTCSKNVCRYHRNIKGMKLQVTSQLTSGAKIRKTFSIRP